jgi:hypothetical protein
MLKANNAPEFTRTLENEIIPILRYSVNKRDLANVLEGAPHQIAANVA